MSSFVSAKGPSTTVSFCPEYLTRQPFELGWSPEASSRTPARCSSSWYLAISAKRGSQTGAIGMTSASESWVAFTMIMNRMILSPLLLGLGCRRAQPLFVLPEFGLELGTEVVRFEDLANLDLEAVIERRTLEPLDRLFFGLHLPQPEAGDQLLRLGERPVDHGPLASREPDTRALRARLQPLRREQHAGFRQLFIELPHRGEGFFVGEDSGLGVLVGFDQHHEAHRALLHSLSACNAWEPTAPRTNSAMGTPIKNACTAMLSTIHNGSFDRGPAADNGRTT